MTRGAVVASDLMAGHRPKVWCSDRYSAQQGHGLVHQTCLAHLTRDAAYAAETSEDFLAVRLKLWLHRAFALSHRISEAAASTIAAKRKALERSLADILMTPTACDVAGKLQRKIANAQDQLLTFADHPSRIAPTNNACERALRPAVIQRKVTNGYRSRWAADVRTAVDTAKLTTKANPFATILRAVSA